VEGFDRKLTVMVLPLHLWLSALAAFNNCQLPGQFTSSEQLKPAAAQWPLPFSGNPSHLTLKIRCGYLHLAFIEQACSLTLGY
jgi:hypothetical protein